MADERIQYTEELVGAGHPTKSDTINRLPLVGHNADGTHKEAGLVLQVVNVQTGALATGSTVFPFDDTIPEKTEGDEYMTLAITPKSAASLLLIDVVWNGASNIAVAYNMTLALFQDNTVNALAAINEYQASGVMLNLRLTHKMTAGSTSPITFKVRAGADQAGTTTFNGYGGNRKFGGVSASSITITEIAA